MEYKCYNGIPEAPTNGLAICWCVGGFKGSREYYHDATWHDSVPGAIDSLYEMMDYLKSSRGYIHYKKDDGEYLETIEITRVYPQKPMDWNFIKPKNWFKKKTKE